MKQKTLQAHLALFIVNVLYGASHVLAKGVMPDYLTPSVFILFRVAGATLLFWLVLSLTNSKPIERKDFPLIALCGLFGVAINQLFFFHGLNLSSAINSGIIMALNPIMVVILSFFLFKERLTSLKITGITLGAVGAILLTLKASSHVSDSRLGDLFLFLNALSYAIYLVLAKPLMKKYSPIQVITWVFTFGLIFVLLFPPTLSQLSQTNFQRISTEIWWKIAYVVIGVTFFTYLLTIFGLKYLSATVSSAYIYTQPVMVMLFTFLFASIHWSADYRGSITSEKILYMFVIFTGVYLTSKSISRNEN
ncbi:MAG: DMT family transporter [Crocinitomicaceae bacterium]|jgi:drug/metabolite transporter (DMT)-like permease|nr:DMT family transporter [Crocinitomicaceae bacterium]MDP4761872.1 DMT family transporter [Crocinitomicaceae bacterium]